MEIVRKKMQEFIAKERPWETFIMTGKRPIPEITYFNKQSKLMFDSRT
jgi:hypothetical protein